MAIQLMGGDAKGNYCSLKVVIIHWRGFNKQLPRGAFLHWKCSTETISKVELFMNSLSLNIFGTISVLIL